MSGKVSAGKALPGWEGGSFSCGANVVGWDVRCGLFWVHSLKCTGNDPMAAARLVQACRAKCRELKFDKMFWQVVPDKTGAVLLKTLSKGRAKIDYIQMYVEV